MHSVAQILKRIKSSVHATDPDATLILYGSYARGDNRTDSDIDILVLINKDKITFEDRKRIGYPLHHLELEEGVLISPMIQSRQQWDTRYKITPLYKNIYSEGKVL
ncbi:MAG: polymerase beta domain protein region [Flavipsychrobacter sp.]|jgi:predicted nucleotidyltransferase|nr:polymerase beta domain protein region [Flavipsychrobacter sp.]